MTLTYQETEVRIDEPRHTNEYGMIAATLYQYDPVAKKFLPHGAVWLQALTEPDKE